MNRFDVQNWLDQSAGNVGSDGDDIDNKGTLLFLEYLKLGDLSQLLNNIGPNVADINNDNARVTRAAERRDLVRDVRREYPPLDVLRRIFNCLVKGCIAMAYPPRTNQLDAAGNRLPVFDEQGDPLEEQVPALGAGWFENIIHFDLDPSNGKRQVALDTFLPLSPGAVPR